MNRKERHKRARTKVSIKSRVESAYDNTTHPLLSIKIIPDSLIALRQELLHHPDIVQECSKSEWNTFELAIARIAQMLNIVMDGEYEPNGLFIMLTEALKSRAKTGELHPHLAAPGHGLKEVEIQETSGEITLVEVGEDLGLSTGENVGTGPYTICDGCVTSFDCITVRGCKLGKPAVQLENTIAELRKSIANGSIN